MLGPGQLRFGYCCVLHFKALGLCFRRETLMVVWKNKGCICQHTGQFQNICKGVAARDSKYRTGILKQLQKKGLTQWGVAVWKGGGAPTERNATPPFQTATLGLLDEDGNNHLHFVRKRKCSVSAWLRNAAFVVVSRDGSREWEGNLSMESAVRRHHALVTMI